ncbi:MAG: beta-galactosidase [Phycisphaerae bacterium]
MNRINESDRQAALDAHRKLNDSPIQRRLREEHATFLGAVWWNPAEQDLEAMKHELRRMKETGFTLVRFHNCLPRPLKPGELDFSQMDEWLAAAEEVGIHVINHMNLFFSLPDSWYMEAGISPEQMAVCHYDDPASRKLLEMYYKPVAERYRGNDTLFAFGMLGEPGGGKYGFTEYDKPRFAQWLRERYETLEAVEAAWNMYPREDTKMVESFEDAWKCCGAPDEVGITGVENAKKVYGARRDMMRYLADKSISRARNQVAAVHAGDPDRVVTIGSHQLFANQPWLLWDTGQWARAGELHFSSIHLSWHFELCAGEVDRPLYMQARMTHDYFKGGMTSAYETTGGAVQYSGGYGTGMTPGLMRRFMCNYLAAGNQSIAFWTWNHRPGGWEMGEYGLTTLSGKISSWAKEAGKVGTGMQKYIGELWEADPETRVALLSSWDTDAVLTQEPKRHDLQQNVSEIGSGTKVQHRRALLGASRAMINSRTPYEYVTEAELREGIACCYPSIYLPHVRAVSEKLAETLLEYVQKGGRLIADVQFAFCDPWGKLHPTGEGGLVDRLFGAYVDTIHDARTCPMQLNGSEIDGFYGDIVPTDARVLSRFADGRPAVTEAKIGKGSAVLIGFDPGNLTATEGREDIEAMIANLVWAGERPGWFSDAPVAFRLRTDSADHYFLTNDGAEMHATIAAYDADYQGGQMVIEEEPVDVDGTITVRVPELSAVWVRLER